MDLLNQFKHRLLRRRLIKQTIDELSVLSDRDLADLGIHREEITRVASISVDAELAGGPGDAWRRTKSQEPAKEPATGLQPQIA